MRRNTLNFWVDLSTLIVMLSMACTGLVIRYILPPGSGGHGGGRGLSLWGMDRHEWGGLHFWLSLVLTGLIALHLVLHWSWVCSTVRRCFIRSEELSGRLSGRAMNLYGLGLIALATLIVGGFYALTRSQVETTYGEEIGGGGGAIGGLDSRLRRGRPRPGDEHDIDQPRPREADRALGRGRGGAGRGQGLGRGYGAPAQSLPARHSDELDRLDIRGHMTLREVARQTGIGTDKLKQLLGLPAATPADERLGRLRRRHGFLMSQTRQIIAAQLKAGHAQ